GPSKLVNGVSQIVVSTGSQFTYAIAFRNSGDTVARNVVVSDQLPLGIEYVPGSLQVNDRAVSDALDGDEGSAQGSNIKFLFARINPGEVFRITLKALLTGAVAGGTGLLHTASFQYAAIHTIK